MSFDAAAVDDLFAKVLSHAAATGYFERVNQHEPKSPPGNGMSAAMWVDSIRPVRSSGQAATSTVVTLMLRIYKSLISLPSDEIDPDVVKASTAMMKAYSGDLNLGGTVRCIDLLGMTGTAMSAQAEYVTIGKTEFRCMTLTVPVILNDSWVQAVSP